MTRWLFATELGGGFGHLSRLREIATGLYRPGDRITVVAFDLDAAYQVFTGLQADFVLAPRIPPRELETYGSYGGLIAQFGFDTPAILNGSCAAWDGVFDQARPDVLIADHAPSVVFASRGHLPCAVIGGGFDLPAAQGSNFALFNPKRPSFDQGAIHQAMSDVAAKRGAPGFEGPAEALAGDYRALVSFPWLDPYQGRRSEPHLGPLGRRPPLAPTPAEAHVFAYLRPTLPGFEAMLWALSDLPMRTSLYIQGSSPIADTSLLRRRGVHIFETPPDLVSLLPTTSVVLSHAGAGLTSNCLFAGRVQVCVPAYSEAGFNALAVDRLGVGRVVYAYDSTAIYWAILKASEDLDLRDAALRVGRAAHALYPESPAPEIAEHIRALAHRLTGVESGYEQYP